MSDNEPTVTTSWPEAAAKTMLCPLSVGGPNDRKCKGSACMGWRWSEVPLPVVLRHHKGYRPPDEAPFWQADEFGDLAEVEKYEAEALAAGNDPSGWTYEWRVMSDPKPPRGFCGLAGTPTVIHHVRRGR